MSRKASPDSKSTKESRCECCGSEMSEISDGTLRKGTYTCKAWRICKKCRLARLALWRSIVLNAARMADEKLYLITLIWDDTNSLINLLRRIRDHNQSYIALRAEDKVYVFHTDPSEGGIKHDIFSLEALDWDKITWTKPGRKISCRGIFKELNTKQKMDLTGMELTETISFKTNAPKSEELALWDEARIECGNPMPTTLEDERAAIEQIAPIFEKKLNEHGYKVKNILHPKRYKRINVTWKPVKCQQVWRTSIKTPQFLSL